MTGVSYATLIIRRNISRHFPKAPRIYIGHLLTGTFPGDLKEDHMKVG